MFMQSSISLPLPQFHSFGVSSSLHQSPIWIKASLMSLRVTLSRGAGTRKSSAPCRVQNGLSQIIWLLASPQMAHGTGSKDSEFSGQTVPFFNFL